MKSGKVSIIIPTYKRSDRVIRAIESALNQDYDDFEVIVVDDNEPNSDERKLTKKNVQQYIEYDMFTYIEHPRNLNGSAARNTGIRNSDGEFITFLDDDDEYYPNKIRLQAECLSSLDSDWGICYTGYEKIDQYENLQVSSEKVEGNLLVQALTKNLFVGSGSNFMVRREIVKELKGFDESFNRNQDLEFLVRVLMKYKMKYIDEITFLIHNEIRENIYTYEELININYKYIETFQPVISQLNDDEQAEIYKTLDLWDIRYAVTSKKLIETIKIFRNSKLTIREVVEYFSYLRDRNNQKTSYGFKLTK